MSPRVPLVYHLYSHCDLVKEGRFKVAAFSETACTASEFEEKHRHDFYEIIWLKNGEGVHQIDLQEHPYSGSVVFILSPGQIHRIHQTKPSEGYVVKFLPSVFHLEKDFANYILDTCLFDEQSACPVIPIQETLQHSLEDVFLNLTHEFRNPETDSDNMVSSYLKILITHINRSKRHKLKDAMVSHDPAYALFRSFKLAIEKHYRHEHSVQFYAEQLNTQARTLNSLSRKYAIRSAGELIQDRILLEAQRSIYHDYRTIKEICFDLGFEDPAYFTRFFKKHTGLSPQQFKEERVMGKVV